MMATTVHNTTLCDAINAGYVSDDEASDYEEEPQDSGRTRSSTRRAAQPISQDSNVNQAKVSGTPKKSSSTDQSKGKKRKKMGSGGDGSESDPDDDENKRKTRVEGSKAEIKVVCSCPKDVMTCIGILPSLPIVSYFHETESESSSAEDLRHTVLPSVCRTRRGNDDDC